MPEITAYRIDRLRHTLPYEAVFALMAVTSLSSLIIEFWLNPTHATLDLLGRVDIFIAWMFFFDFMLGLYIHRDRWAYLKSDWYLLIAAIPINEGLFSALRILRLIRILRIYSTLSRSLALPGMKKKLGKDEPHAHV